MNRPLPPLRPLRELSAEPVDPVKFRIDGWQPTNSRIVAAAQYKAGKTTLVGNTIRSLVDGDRFLGAFAVNPIAGTLALLDFEMSPAMLTEWLKSQEIQHDDRVFPVALRGRSIDFNVLDTRRRTEWAKHLRANQTSYLVWDCVRPVIDALGLDENRDAGRLLTAFDALLDEAGIPEALVIQHMGHGRDRARGDSRFRDWPDAEWRLVRRSDAADSVRYISAHGRDVLQPELELRFDALDRRLTVPAGSSQSVQFDGVLSTVIEALAEGELSGRQLEERFVGKACSRQTLRGALKAGVRTGLLTGRAAKNRGIYYSSPVRQGAPKVRQRTSAPCANSIRVARTGEPPQERRGRLLQVVRS